MRCKIASRGLRESVTLQQPATPSSGETTPTWTDVAAVRASITAAAANGRAGTEQAHANAMEGRTNWVVRIRQYSAIDPSWRLKWGSRYLNVMTAYDPDNMGRWTEMLCVEVNP
jgi:SPP1 family predicted phage head-tail adaptor